jgi:N-methylhydantoinase A/oxoprolinase/acetone carboxylase beta subunit
MKIFPEKSVAAIDEIAQKMKKSLEETAQGIIRIANANMEKAIRVISIERGYDPRNFALFSFGGAGGMHAAEIANQLGIKKIIVPKNAGVLSAIGLLLADSVKDCSASVLKPVGEITKAELYQLFRTLEHKGLMDMKQEGFAEKDLRVNLAMDLRYSGQSYEITVPLSKKDIVRATYASKFHRAHQKLYSYQHPGRTVEVVNIRLKIVGPSQKIRFDKFPPKGMNPQRAFLMKQDLFFSEKTYDASVYDRSALDPGNEIQGPALVLDHESTTFLPPAYALKVDPYLNLIIEHTG